MKTIQIEKDTRIPGTNLILEQGDRLFYEATSFKGQSIDDFGKDAIQKEIGKSGLDVLIQFEAKGFSNEFDYTFGKNYNGIKAENDYSATIVVTSNELYLFESYSDYSENNPVFKGRHSDIKKAIKIFNENLYSVYSWKELYKPDSSLRRKIDSDDQEFLEKELGPEGLNCILRLTDYGFYMNPTGSRAEYEAYSERGYRYIVKSKDRMEIYLSKYEKRPIFKGKYSDVEKGIKFLKDWIDKTFILKRSIK